MAVWFAEAECVEPLHHQPGQTIPNTVIAKLGVNGDVCIFTQLGTDFVADLQGWYPGGIGPADFEGRSQIARL